MWVLILTLGDLSIDPILVLNKSTYFEIDETTLTFIREQIIQRTISALKSEGITYRGENNAQDKTSFFKL